MWKKKTQIIAAVAVAGTELFSSAITLNPGKSAHIQVIGNSNGTTDNLIIAVYGSLDAGGQNWDTVAVFKIELDCTDGNDNDISFVVSGLYSFRIGCVRSGTTNTITTDAYYRKLTL